MNTVLGAKWRLSSAKRRSVWRPRRASASTTGLLSARPATSIARPRPSALPADAFVDALHGARGAHAHEIDDGLPFAEAPRRVGEFGVGVADDDRPRMLEHRVDGRHHEPRDVRAAGEGVVAVRAVDRRHAAVAGVAATVLGPARQ